MTTRKIDQLLAHYGQSHQHPGNERIHFIAIPLIVWSLLGMLYALHPWLAYGLVALSMVYYARLSMVFLGAMAMSAAVALLLVHAVDRMGTLLNSAVAVFVVAWIFQFIGHNMEGKKPSFLEDLQYLLVGPMFVLSKLFLKLGVRW